MEIDMSHESLFKAHNRFIIDIDKYLQTFKYSPSSGHRDTEAE